MSLYKYKTKGVCSSQITFDIENNIVRNIAFKDGCSGNLRAVAALCEGKTVDEIEAVLAPVRCGRKKTSCAHQLALAVRLAEQEAASAAGGAGNTANTASA